MAGWGHLGKQHRSLTWPARRADEPPSAKPPCDAHGSAALPVSGLVGWASGSVIVFLIALAALLVAGHHAGAVRR